MLRTVLTSITIVEALWPETLIDTAEGIALDNPDECELKSWVVPGARLEGLVFLVLMWRSNTSYSQLKKFLGVIGILALLYPRAYVDYAAEIAYTDATHPLSLKDSARTADATYARVHAETWTDGCISSARS